MWVCVCARARVLGGGGGLPCTGRGSRRVPGRRPGRAGRGPRPWTTPAPPAAPSHRPASPPWPAGHALLDGHPADSLRSCSTGPSDPPKRAQPPPISASHPSEGHRALQHPIPLRHSRHPPRCTRRRVAATARASAPTCPAAVPQRAAAHDTLSLERQVGRRGRGKCKRPSGGGSHGRLRPLARASREWAQLTLARASRPATAHKRRHTST